MAEKASLSSCPWRRYCDLLRIHNPLLRRGICSSLDKRGDLALKDVEQVGMMVSYKGYVVPMDSQPATRKAPRLLQARLGDWDFGGHAVGRC